ncbi:low affinity K(+) transporter 1 [Monosporozyma servazzii]
MAESEWESHINQKLFSDVDEALFRNHSFKTVSSYVLGTYLFLVLKVAFLISDLYTCIKLLAYNKWSNNIIKPYLPFRISKWLFSACILLSIVFLLWNVIFGIKTYKTKNITKCYVNNFSRNFISVTDYSKFCIFDKISSHGAFQWFAFYVFFELKSCLGLIFCDTPRQVINGLTLWSALVTTHNGNSMNLGDLESFEGLINKIKMIAEDNHGEAVLLSFSLFSFILWIIFITKLIFALICSIFVYFKLIREGVYSGLRDYIYTIISNHVDDLVITQTEKRRNEVYRTHLLGDTSSMVDLDYLERDSMGSKPMFKLYNDSLNSLHRVRDPAAIYSQGEDAEYDEECEVDGAASLNEPIPLLSTIPQQGDLFKRDYIRHLKISTSGTDEIFGSYKSNDIHHKDNVDDSTTDLNREAFIKTTKKDNPYNLSQSTVTERNVYLPQLNEDTVVMGSGYSQQPNDLPVKDFNESNEYYNQTPILNGDQHNATFDQTPIANDVGYSQIIDEYLVKDEDKYMQPFKETPALESRSNDHTFRPSYSKINDSSRDTRPNFNRPLPPSLSINSHLNASNSNHIFTPDRAYFRDIDLENSPFLPHKEQFDNSFKGHKY